MKVRKIHVLADGRFGVDTIELSELSELSDLAEAHGLHLDG